MYSYEIFKDIPDYEGIYQASNYGRIKSLSRKDTLGRDIKEKILNPISVGNCKYLRVNLKKPESNKPKTMLLHRLIISTFNGKSEKYVNHINRNKLDNNLSNLEYVSHRENDSHFQLGKKSRHSKYVGVTWDKKPKKWLSRIMIDGKSIFLGSYDDEKKAANAYIDALDNNGIKNNYAIEALRVA